MFTVYYKPIENLSGISQGSFVEKSMEFHFIFL